MTSIFQHFADLSAVAIQSDGKIVSAGRVGSYNDGWMDFALTRHNADGSVDTSFGTDGVVRTKMGTFSQAYALLVQPDGKIVAAGEDSGYFALARYMPDGSLDMSFGKSGIVRTLVGQGGSAQALLLQPDGKLVAVGGSIPESGPNAFALVRYKPNGSLDPTFGTAGIAQTEIPSWSGASDAALQPDGKIVASSGGPRAEGWVLARFESDGRLDKSFGHGGTVVNTAVGDLEFYSLVGLQADGKILAAGTSSLVVGDTRTSDIAIARYLPNGSPDTNFGTDGLVKTRVGHYSGAYDIHTEPDGDILAAGVFWGSADEGYGGDVVVRYKPDGTLDPSFGGAGVVKTPTRLSGFEGASAMALAQDGKIVAGGRGAVTPPGSGTRYSFALARYLSDGSPDPSFGSDGTVKTAVGAAEDIADDVAVEADGEILAGGSRDGRFLILRFSPNGSNTGFGGFYPSLLDGRVRAVEVLPDRKVLAAGNNKLVRYRNDGTLDFDFAEAGIASPGETTDLRALAVQPDGKIVVAGSGQSSDREAFLVARYDSDGALDKSFGTGGVVQTSFGSGSDSAHAVAIQPDGKIVAAGVSQGHPAVFALARYTRNGVLDPSFSSDGKVTTVIGSDAMATGLAVQANGKIVAGGQGSTRGRSGIAVARYMENGLLDSAFGGAGVVLTRIGSQPTFGRAVALQPNGKILAAGGVEISDSETRFAVARYLANGDLDPEFDSDGVVTTAFGSLPGQSYANAIAVQPDGKIVAAGHGCCEGFALARYQGDSHTLTVTERGSGKGVWITSRPAGIACGSTCSAEFADEISVTLTAAPNSWAVHTWGGACSGKGASCRVKMSGDRTVVATFSICVVPRVKHKTIRAARRAVHRAHCDVGRVSRTFSRKVRKNHVIRQRPKPGTKLRAGSKVDLVVSKGKRRHR